MSKTLTTYTMLSADASSPTPMSFAAATAALKQLDKVTTFCRKTNNGSQNCWVHAGREFMFELGSERRDGAVAGRIYELRNNRAYEEGVFHITAEGAIICFPFLPPSFFE